MLAKVQSSIIAQSSRFRSDCKQKERTEGNQREGDEVMYGTGSPREEGAMCRCVTSSAARTFLNYNKQLFKNEHRCAVGRFAVSRDGLSVMLAI